MPRYSSGRSSAARRAAVDDDLVTALDEPATDLLDARLEAAVPGRDAPRAHHGDTHDDTSPTLVDGLPERARPGRNSRFRKGSNLDDNRTFHPDDHPVQPQVAVDSTIGRRVLDDASRAHLDTDRAASTLAARATQQTEDLDDPGRRHHRTSCRRGGAATQPLRPSLGRIAARGGAVTVAGQIARIGVQMTSVVVLARLLTPHDYGVVAMVLAVIGVGELLRDFGLSSAAIQAPVLTRGQQTNLFWINTGLGGAADRRPPSSRPRCWPASTTSPSWCRSRRCSA